MGGKNCREVSQGHSDMRCEGEDYLCAEEGDGIS